VLFVLHRFRFDFFHAFLEMLRGIPSEFCLEIIEKPTDYCLLDTLYQGKDLELQSHPLAVLK
jgi:hypothetical protein